MEVSSSTETSIGLAPLSSFRKEAKGNVLFFGAKKRTKRNIHPLQGLPLYGEDATLKIAETDDFQINTKVKSTIKGRFWFLSAAL